MERDFRMSMSFDKPITFSNVCESPTPRFDPNDPHYLYQERKKSRILQRSMSEIIQEPTSPPPPAVVLHGDPKDPHTLLRAVFQYYCRFGRTSTQGCAENTLDNVNFAKFCRECPNLLGPTFTKVDVDLTFCKVKIKGERRITYAMFLEAIGVMALKKFPSLALDTAVPQLLQDHIATLPCLKPGSVSPTRSSIVVTRASMTPPKSPPRSPLSANPPDPANTAVILDKAQLSLEQYQRQVHIVESLSDKPGATPFEVQDLEDRIKFCYMLQDEVSNLLCELPRGHEAYRRMCKEVELLSINLEASVKVMAKLQIQRNSQTVEESTQGKENAALRKLFPNGPALSVQEAMKKIMQAELDRVAGSVQQRASYSPQKDAQLRIEEPSTDVNMTATPPPPPPLAHIPDECEEDPNLW